MEISCQLWGGRGGSVHPYIYIMILLEINRLSSFGLGLSYRGRSLSNYTVKRLDVSLLLFTVSFVFTKYNA